MSESTPPLSLDDSKKRTRVTPSQLTILEETFSVSATPDSKMRKQLALKLQMPERSIQIWFQNRRAKVKMLQRRVLLRQEQEAARARLCADVTNPYWYQQQQQLQQQQQQNYIRNKLPIHRAWSTDMISNGIPPPPPPLMFHYPQQTDHPSISITGPPNNELDEDIYSLTISPSPTPHSFAVPRRMESEPLYPNPNTPTLHNNTAMITATAVTVGTWHRMKISQQDLMCYYKSIERTFSWHIRDSNYHFKMMISFDSIASIELVLLEDHVSAQIEMMLIEPPLFFMENATNGSWVQCNDFTEGMQASIVLHHSIRGLAMDLQSELLALAGTDERLRQITRFPSAFHQHGGTSIEQALLMSQHHRHQSLPPTSNQWVLPPY